MPASAVAEELVGHRGSKEGGMHGRGGMTLGWDHRIYLRWIAAAMVIAYLTASPWAQETVSAPASPENALRSFRVPAAAESLLAPPLPHTSRLIEFRSLLDPPAEAWTAMRAMVDELGFAEDPASLDDLEPAREWADLRRARRLLGRSDPARGERLLASLATYSSDTTIRREAALSLGGHYVRHGRYERAAEVLGEVLAAFERPSDRWRVRFWIASALMGTRETVASAEVFREAAAEAPERSRARAIALRLSGWQYRRAELDSEAQEVWRAALSAAGGFPSLQDTLRQDLAEVSFADEDWEDVIALLGTDHPGGRMTARSRFLLGRAYLNAGEPDSARTQFEHFLQIHPEAPEAWRDEAHLLLGWEALRRKEPARALAYYDSVDDERRFALPQIDYGSALALLDEGRYEEAAALLEPVPPVGPESPLYYPWVYALAYARFHQDAYLDAITQLEAFRGRTEADSLSRSAWSLRGDCYYRLDRPDEAYAAYVKAASLLADAPELLLRRQALAAMAAERWGAAARILGDLIVKHPAADHLAEYHFWRAEAFYRLGRLEMARRHYQRAETAGADPVKCAYALGWCAYREQRWEEALTQFEQARAGCRSCGFATDLALRRGNSLFNMGRLEAAAQAFAEALELAEARRETLLVAEASFRHAWALLRSDSFDEAARAFADIRLREGRTRDAAEALYWEGQAYFRQADYRAAQERLLALLEHPGTTDSLRARALLAVGDAYFNQEQPGEALEWYRRILEAPGADRRLRLTAHESLFECRTARGEWDQAYAVLGEIEERFPETQGTGDRYLTVADGFFRDGRYVDALESYGDFLESAHPEDPRTLRVRYQMAVARVQIGQRAQAASAFEALGEREFHYQSEALIKAGMLRLELGQPEEALTSLEMRLSLHLTPREEVVTRAYLAEAYQRLGEMPAARTEWEKVATAESAVSDSLRATASLQLGRLAFADREWSAAHRRFAAAESLGLPGRVYRGAYWAGEAAYRSGDTLRATEWLEQFLRAGEEEALWEATARIRLAECYEGLGREEKAREQYERVLELPLQEHSFQEEARRRLVQMGELPPPHSGEDTP